MKAKSMNPVVVQFIRLDMSAYLFNKLEFQEPGVNESVRIDLL